MIEKKNVLLEHTGAVKAKKNIWGCDLQRVYRSIPQVKTVTLWSDDGVEDFSAIWPLRRCRCDNYINFCLDSVLIKKGKIAKPITNCT